MTVDFAKRSDSWRWHFLIYIYKYIYIYSFREGFVSAECAHASSEMSCLAFFYGNAHSFLGSCPVEPQCANFGQWELPGTRSWSLLLSSAFSQSLNTFTRAGLSALLKGTFHCSTAVAESEESVSQYFPLEFLLAFQGFEWQVKIKEPKRVKEERSTFVTVKKCYISMQDISIYDNIIF